jgi:hypothetical protein
MKRKEIAMTERTHLETYDIDANGNCVLFYYPDGGNPQLPEMVTLHASNARHALSVDPTHYSIELRGAASEIDAIVAELVAARKAAADRSLAAAAAAQLRADRVQAWRNIHARKAAAAAAKPRSGDTFYPGGGPRVPPSPTEA